VNVKKTTPEGGGGRDLLTSGNWLKKRLKKKKRQKRGGRPKKGQKRAVPPKKKGEEKKEGRVNLFPSKNPPKGGAKKPQGVGVEKKKKRKKVTGMGVGKTGFFLGKGTKGQRSTMDPLYRGGGNWRKKTQKGCEGVRGSGLGGGQPPTQLGASRRGSFWKTGGEKRGKGGKKVNWRNKTYLSGKKNW